MSDFLAIEHLSVVTESILCSPFEWCWVEGGDVELIDATEYGGTRGGICQVKDFAIAKYPITNAQYERFIKNVNGYSNLEWWEYSSEASQWRKDHKNPKPTAFAGNDLPRTRTSWFDSMAFCYWLSSELKRRTQLEKASNALEISIRLPTEQEWQRAALGDTGYDYPWGNELDEDCGNYGSMIGQVSSVEKYSKGKSIFGVMDMIGNVWEWCLTGWNQEGIDVSGYTYRAFKGGAWNVKNPDYLRANDRGCHPPRGRLNDCGFRVLLCLDDK